MARVLGLGNALVDVLINIDNDELLTKLKLRKGSMQLVDENFLALATEATRGLEQSTTAGGSAANTINGLANLGIECAFIGKVGSDPYGTYYHDDLLKNQIKPFLLRGKAQTGRATVLISNDSERSFGTYLGAAVEMLPGELTPGLFEGYDYLHIEGYLVQNHALIEKAMRLAKENGMMVSLDMASYNVVEANRNFLKEVIDNYVDIVFANEEEAKAFSGSNPEQALHELAGMVDTAIVKLGSMGSIIRRGDEYIKVGVITAQPLDTTGAGDLYAAGFLFGLVNGLPLVKCGQVGAILSGNVIEVIGPRMDVPRWRKVRLAVKEIIDR